MPFDTTTPAILLKAPHHGGLGLVRSLGRLGAPVYAVDSDRWSPAFLSRYCRRAFRLDMDRRPQDTLRRLLEIAGCIGGNAILIPTTDQAALFVADHAQTLRQGFRFPSAGAALVRSLYNKREMYSLARRNGLSIPDSAFPESRCDVVNFAARSSFPVFIKAADDARLRTRFGKTKFLAKTPADLLRLYDVLQDPKIPNLVLQDYLPGSSHTDWIFNGYFDEHSQCLFGMTGRKLRQFPTSTGVTSLGVCEHNETVAAISVEFMSAIGYRGIVDIDFRLDLRDRRYKVLDVNPRIGCTFRALVSRDGLDVARAQYLHLTGQRIPAVRPLEGRKWLVEDFDFMASVSHILRGTLSLKSWFKSLRGVKETACLAMDDPLPLLSLAWSDLRDLVRLVRRASMRESRSGEHGLAVGVAASSHQDQADARFL